MIEVEPAVVHDAEALVARCYAPTRRALYAFSGSWDLAEEATQEAMAKLWLRGADATGDDRCEAWAFVVGANYLRSRWRRMRLERRHADGQHHQRAVADNAATSIVDQQALVDALRTLPARQRQAVVLRHLLDATIEDAAAVMGCQPGTVRSLTAKAVKTLRGHLDAEGSQR